ncbi:MAG: hypothetical protein II155_00685 [Clostridia bacterium]|nr:hypothetical protein [Clostridia bacterium]
MKKSFFIKLLGTALAVSMLLLAVGCSKGDGQGDYIVTIETPSYSSEPTYQPTYQPTDEPTTEPTVQPSAAVTEEPTPTPSNPGNTVVPLVSQSGTYYKYEGLNLVRVDNRAFELSVFDEGVVTLYANLVNDTADALAGKTTVYSLIVPTSDGIMMPDDIRPQIAWLTKQGEDMGIVFSKMNDKVRKVNIYNRLMCHRDECLYFRTDHHWDGIGAYYAYEEFCSVKGITPYTRAQRTEKLYDGFLGSLYNESNGDQALMPADTVHAYLPVCSSATMVFYDAEGKGTTWPIVADVSNYKASAKYGCFAGGDHPLTVFTNPEVTDGSVLIIVKESYGNALMPLLVDHYSKVYEVDYRYWKGNLIDLANEVNATDLIFANNFTMISGRSMIGKISLIVKK